MLNKTVTPNITTFAESAWQFRQHFSGGNSTKPGMFSLFYSLPSHYWSAMLDQKQGPVFIKTLLEKHYATRIFCSAEIEVPPYYATLFHDIPNLPLYTPGNTPGERDRYITQEFQQFLTKRNSQEPFFSLLFYNAAHGFCQPQPFEQPFQPTVNHCNRFLLNNRADPTPYRHRYQNALYFIDKEVNKVLSTLKQQKLLNNTVIIITGDHGQEFNDTHHNSWEHASNYTPYQLQTPLVIYWPKHSANIFNHQTSHYDIIPLLMRQALACDNPPSDYSIGDSLLDDKPRQYLIAGSYTHFGIIEHDRITTIFPSGRISISDPMMNPLPKAKPRLAVVNQVMHDLRKFFAN